MDKILIKVILLSSLIALSTISAQGISRSSGLGFRIGSWSKNLGEFRFLDVGNGSVGVSGSAFLHFFTRYRENWFWEFNIGGIGDVVVDSKLGEAERVTGIVPMIFGLRNDFLANRAPGNLQPYYSFGLGPYIVGSESSDIRGTSSVKSGLKLGVYGGTGVNLAFSSWFAFNVDLKYHFVQFSLRNPASGLNLNFGISFMWGKKRGIFRIKETKLIVSDIYPAYYQFYSIYPLAFVTVQNISGYPIEVNLRSKVIPFSARLKESGFIELAKGEVRDIPVTAIFESNITRVSSREPAVLNIEVEGRAGTTHKEEISAQITIHTRNSWNGEVDKLSFFITPDDKEIIQFSRQIIKLISDTAQSKTINVLYAEKLFNELMQIGLRYQSDPNIPFYKDDRVQFANETLKLFSGDCDDLVVIFASMLESLGIKTAFVEVRDPEKELAHLYLIFDSGVSIEDAQLVSSNRKRYLIRKDQDSNSTVWLPIETTLIARGFEEAWKSGALNYLQEVELRNGLAEGWVRIIDVE